MLACALFSFAFAVFHMFFWKLLQWPTDLMKVSATNRAVTQVLNLRLIYIFLAIGVICLAYPVEMRTSKVGRALLIGMSCFWAGRLTEQFIFFREQPKYFYWLNLSFFTGALLFLAPAII